MTVIAALASAVPIAAQTPPQAGGLPVVRIDTKDEAPILDRVNYVNMTFALTDIDNPSNDITVVSNTDGIRGRGNSTWKYTKKSYRIKFDKKQSLFGLPAAKSWVLLAEYIDPTLIMNTTAFELGNILGLPYNHTYHHVQLYLNGEYQGVYGLTEQNQVSEGRVDIDEEYGWFIEMDSYYDEEPKFNTSSYNLPIMIKSPEAEPADISNPAYGFVRKDVNELCDSMASANFPENGFRDLIDMNTFVDFLMVNDVVMNGELWHPKSTYLYKDYGGKISMGPLWDFDWAFGYIGYGITHFIDYTGRSDRHSFFNRFFEDPVFTAKYKERWNEKYTEILAVSEFIGDMGTKLKVAAAENFKIWHTYNNYARQITNMKEWWNNRCLWLNSELNKIEVLPASKTFATRALGYSDAAPQTITLVSYGDMTDLSATLQSAESSYFEISAGLNKTPTGNGGYLATVSVRPKNSLPVASYQDTLVLSGSNQGQQFSFNVPLAFAVVEKKTPAAVVFPVFRESIVYSPTRTLSKIELNGSGDGKFVWEDSAIVPSVNVGAYNVIFVPNDTVQYDYSKTQLSKIVGLTVEKANPAVRWPKGVTAAVGQTLDDVPLASFENDGGPAGVFSWTMPDAPAGGEGARWHSVTFTPADSANYNTMTESIMVDVLRGKFILGPNPVAKQSGTVNIYREGKPFADCELLIYDALGNVINKVRINDKAIGSGRRLAGSWNLKDAKGRRVPTGTYLIRGRIITSDGRSEKVSVILAVW